MKIAFCANKVFTIPAGSVWAESNFFEILAGRWHQSRFTAFANTAGNNAVARNSVTGLKRLYCLANCNYITCPFMPRHKRLYIITSFLRKPFVYLDIGSANAACPDFYQNFICLKSRELYLLDPQVSWAM